MNLVNAFFFYGFHIIYSHKQLKQLGWSLDFICLLLSYKSVGNFHFSQEDGILTVIYDNDKTRKLEA